MESSTRVSNLVDLTQDNVLYHDPTYPHQSGRQLLPKIIPNHEFREGLLLVNVKQ